MEIDNRSVVRVTAYTALRCQRMHCTFGTIVHDFYRTMDVPLAHATAKTRYFYSDRSQRRRRMAYIFLLNLLSFHSQSVASSAFQPSFCCKLGMLNAMKSLLSAMAEKNGQNLWLLSPLHRFVNQHVPQPEHYATIRRL
jgi:hypothetical protein